MHRRKDYIRDGEDYLRDKEDRLCHKEDLLHDKATLLRGKEALLRDGSGWFRDGKGCVRTAKGLAGVAIKLMGTYGICFPHVGRFCEAADLLGKSPTHRVGLQHRLQVAAGIPIYVKTMFFPTVQARNR